MNYQFFAETLHGYTIKVIIEVLQNCLANDAYFQLTETGIKFCCSDEQESTLINFNLERENFDNYHCQKNMTIAINLKHLHKLLKNVKKKDSITLFIDKDNFNRLWIKVVPIAMNKKLDRAETSHISIREVAIKDYDVPTGYHYPKVIPSTEYQKMCKKMTIVPGKVITITIQQNNYISFYCDGGDIISSEMAFGSIDPKLDKDSTYIGSFYTTMLNQLIKMPGLSPKMQISAPKNNGFPIRIKMQAGNLGMIEVYLKTKKQIEYEESMKH